MLFYSQPKSISKIWNPDRNPDRTMMNSLNLVRSGFYLSENPDRTKKMPLNIGPIRIFLILKNPDHRTDRSG